MLSAISGMLSRENVAKAATELAEHLQIIENIRALQIGQKALADEIASVNARLFEFQAELRSLRSDTKLECIREIQQVLNAVQGGFNQRLETLSNKMAVMEARQIDPIIQHRPPPNQELLEPTEASKPRTRALRKT